MTPKEYYEKVTGVDLVGLARSMIPDRITEAKGSTLLIDCPRHVSESKRSLRINGDKGAWYCFACEAGGGPIEFVEFVQNGTTWTTRDGAMTGAHRTARDFLGDRLGLGPLAKAGLSADEIQRVERERTESERVFSALTEITRIYHEHLLKSQDVLDWIREQWGFDEPILKHYQVGYVGVPDIYARLLARGHSHDSIIGTGMFVITETERVVPVWGARLFFPYWSRGRVVYGIGRTTPWTKKGGPKYKKIATYNAHLRPYVSRAIDNGVLFGEDVLASKPKDLTVTEGITDAMATSWRGYPCISPVTVGFSKKDIERLAHLLVGVGRVTVIQDNEFSGIGFQGALKTARVLQPAGIRVHVGLIPVPEEQAKARKALSELIGPTLTAEIQNAEPVKRGILLRQGLPDDTEIRKRAGELLSQSKVDLCEWWRTATGEEFEQIVETARTAIEVAIDSVPKHPGDPVRQIEAIQELVGEIGLLPSVHRDAGLRRLKEAIGIPLTQLRSVASERARAIREKEQKDSGSSATKKDGAPGIVASLAGGEEGSLKEILHRHAQSMVESKVPVSFERLGHEAMQWFEDHGAKFFCDLEGNPKMHFDGVTFDMAGRGGPREAYESLIFRHSGIVVTGNGGRVFYAVLKALAVGRSETRPNPTWVETRAEDHEVYVTCNNVARQIVRLSPEGVEVVLNGRNTGGVLLEGTPKIKPIAVANGLDHQILREEFESRVGENMACTYVGQDVLFYWVTLFPMIQMMGTRPMLRLEGDAGSGKTWAAKVLTTLVYGEEEQKKGSIASNYVDAMQNPLVCLDNVEQGNVSQDLIDFFLLVVTGVVREKRAANSDVGIVREKPNALVMTTGIEPLGGSLTEIMSRTLIVEFDVKRQKDVMSEVSALRQVRIWRSEFLTMVFQRCAAMLKLMQEHDALNRALLALNDRMGSHAKKRCNEFFALCSISDAAAHGDVGLVDTVSGQIQRMIDAVNTASARISSEDSPLAFLFGALFAQLEGGELNPSIVGLRYTTGIRKIANAKAREIFLALSLAAKNAGIRIPYRSSVQLGRRIQMAKQDMLSSGFDVNVERDRTGVNRYSVRMLDDSEVESPDLSFDVASFDMAAAGDDGDDDEFGDR